MPSAPNEPRRVELLAFDGCPSCDALLAGVRELLQRSGAHAQLSVRRVQDDAIAQRERFLGSPTVRVDGHDIEPGANDRTDYGMTCRLYRTPDGLVGAPPLAWLEAALAEPDG
jgi:hypothetical protein